MGGGVDLGEDAGSAVESGLGSGAFELGQPGLPRKIAVSWQRLAAGDWTTYAANVGRRTDQ
jgi:hypothetical protein